MKYINKTVAIFAGITLLFSCADLDTFPEGDYLSGELNQQILGARPEFVTAEISGMYAILGQQFCVYGAAQGRHDDFGFPFVALAQDMNGPDMACVDDGYNWFGGSLDYSDRTYTFANPYMRFAIFYKQIAAANNIIASIDEGTDNAELRASRAQARAIRAFDYLSLVPYYQYKYKGNETKLSVPLITDEPAPSNPRAPLEDVYKQILEDLDYAIEVLEGYTRTTKAEIDQNVAYGLRARANLYMENWAAAAADADKALQGYQAASMDDVSKPAFIDANDTYWMWAVLIGPDKVPNAFATWPAKLSSFSGMGYAAAVNCYKTINRILFDLIPETDVRKGWWVDANLESPNLATVTWGKATGNDIPPLVLEGDKVPFLPYTNVKFGQYGGGGGTTNAGDWCLMRAEEMILIKAEGLAMSGGNGRSVLEDFIKTHRDPSYVCPATSGVAFQNEIWKQRRIELWGEGFAMSDIMRLGKPVVRIVEGKDTNFPPNFQFNIAPDDEWLLMRFPQQEMNSNPDVVQNDGGSLPKRGDGASLRDGITD